MNLKFSFFLLKIDILSKGIIDFQFKSCGIMILGFNNLFDFDLVFGTFEFPEYETLPNSAFSVDSLTFFIEHILFPLLK